MDSNLTRHLEEGALGAALEWIVREANRRRLTIDEQILRAELLCEISSSEEPLCIADQLSARSDVSKRDRARCFAVAGSINIRVGKRARGLELFSKAKGLAEALGEPILRCAVQLAWFGAVAGWVSSEAAVAELAATRRIVHAAGVPSSTIKFHLLVGELEARRGFLSRFKRHVATARTLLETFPHLHLSGELALREAVIAILSSDIPSALTSCRIALDLAGRCGSLSQEVVARTNLAHVMMAGGHLQQARRELSTAHDLCRAGGGAEIGILDGLMQVALLAGSLPEAEVNAERAAALIASEGDEYSYYGLWHALTRVRWLMRTNRIDEAVALALDSLPRIARMADRALLERMQLLAAEGLARSGRADDGARLLAEAVVANQEPALEMIAEAARVAGCVAAADNQAAAVLHFERATRVLATVGNVTARGEVVLNAAQAFAAAEGTGPPPLSWHSLPALYRVPRRVSVRFDTSQPVLADSRPPTARAAETAGAIMDLAGHPPLLGHEVLSLIADAETAGPAALVAHDAAGTELLAWCRCDARHAPALASEGDVRHIDLGSQNTRRYEIVVRPTPAPSSRATLAAIERLVGASRALHAARQREREQSALWPEQTPEQQLGMIFASQSMVDLVKTTRRLAATNITVLITGETGTGKELLARALHEASARRSHPFVPFNCTAVARDMLDAQLFGYRRGSFTGAQEAFPGVIRAAAGGTLFLDEIGEIGPDVQPKLLRFLESGEIHPLAESRPIDIDVRVVAATNANLDHLVSEGRFRKDLFYRLNVVRLQVPPLRERREEIPLLVEHFLEKYGHEARKPGLRVAEETMEYLALYKWPGNIRQLANELRRMVALAESGAVLMPEHLSREIAASRRTVPASERDLAPTELVVRLDQPLAAATEHLERSLIQHALTSESGMDQAARRLGLSRKGLYLKRQRLGLD